MYMFHSAEGAMLVYPVDSQSSSFLMSLESGCCCQHGIVCAIISVRRFHSLIGVITLTDLPSET